VARDPDLSPRPEPVPPAVHGAMSRLLYCTECGKQPWCPLHLLGKGFAGRLSCWLVPICTTAGYNMQSAEVRPSAIMDDLSSELRAGRVLGPVNPAATETIQVNRLELLTCEVAVDHCLLLLA